jgi:DNA helicase-2/ATP-dependent DNA helicase PcrA
MPSDIRLSKIQKEAVDHGEGALLVIAGPGSGKTRVLTERIRRLLTEESDNFHVLALTFTNKAANEMKERLEKASGILDRSFIGTLHSFCLQVLQQRGKPVGVEGQPVIFNSIQDRKEILLRAIYDDPDLLHVIRLAGDHKAQKAQADEWMRKIATHKSNLLDSDDIEDEIERKAFDGYNAELRSSGAIDYDDLLILTCRLFQTRPKIAGFYTRLYKYICIDEAQDLNRAQYGVILSLCVEDYRNVMMVGDPKQSIYGFVNADPGLMYEFEKAFDAKRIDLDENYRSSSEIVRLAKCLNPNYEITGRLPIRGEVGVYRADDESDEAKWVVEKLETLLKTGHSDIEGGITLEKCAILARTRYALIHVERMIRDKGIQFYKNLSATYEYETDVLQEFELCLRLMINPKDKLHLDQLKKRWYKTTHTDFPSEFNSLFGLQLIQKLAEKSNSSTCAAVAEACGTLSANKEKMDFVGALKILARFADSLEGEEKRAVWEDLEVLRGEWDRYLRSKVGGSSDLGSFLTHIALGTTQQPHQEGVGLLTVHSSKGLEFSVVFVVGMCDGVFPDYRARSDTRAMEEERRNAYVATSRSKRLLFFSYPAKRTMPWGDVWDQQPSVFLRDMGLLK